MTRLRSVCSARPHLSASLQGEARDWRAGARQLLLLCACTCREMAAVIEKLQGQVADAKRAVEKALEEAAVQGDKSSNEEEEEEGEEAEEEDADEGT